MLDGGVDLVALERELPETVVAQLVGRHAVGVAAEPGTEETERAVEVVVDDHPVARDVGLAVVLPEEGQQRVGRADEHVVVDRALAVAHRDLTAAVLPGLEGVLPVDGGEGEDVVVDLAAVA